MSDNQLAYTWEIAGKQAVSPEVFYRTAAENGYNLVEQSLLFIDCPRGAQPGKARILLGKDDAAAVIALTGPQTITIKKYDQSVQPNGFVNWQVSATHNFSGYYPITAKDVFGINDQNVLVELLDERYILQVTQVAKRYNVVKVKGQDGFGDYNPTLDEYDDSTLITTDTPYTYQQILNELLTGIASLTLPSSPSPPRNLTFECSLADALDQLLASLGFCLVFNPLATSNRYSIVDLTDDADLSIAGAAELNGQLIEKANLANGESTTPIVVGVRACDIVELEDEAKELPAKPNVTVSGSGTEGVLINDHEFVPDVSRIESAVNAWYGERDYLRDETYHGIVTQPPTNHLSNVCWSHIDGRTQTRIENRLPGSIPWPRQPILAKADAEESSPKPAFIVQGLLGTRPGSDPESKFPAWGGDLTTVYCDESSILNISPAPYTDFTPFATCRNPFMLNGEEGDTFIAMRDPNAEEEGDEFILIAVHSKKATIFFTFASDRGNGLYDITCTGTVKSWRHAGDDSPLVLKDTMGRAIGAKSGDYGYAEWNTDKQCWSIISAQHYATRILGKTISGAGASPWSCSPLIGFDGHVSTGDTMDVVIDAGWPHPGINKKVWYELDPADGTWHAYQMEFTCPDA